MLWCFLTLWLMCLGSAHDAALLWACLRWWWRCRTSVLAHFHGVHGPLLVGVQLGRSRRREVLGRSIRVVVNRRGFCPRAVLALCVLLAVGCRVRALCLVECEVVLGHLAEAPAFGVGDEELEACVLGV